MLGAFGDFPRRVVADLDDVIIPSDMVGKGVQEVGASRGVGFLPVYICLSLSSPEAERDTVRVENE